jgi:PAS domain S-box-containing protein
MSRVLIIDDCVDAIRYLTHVLGKNGYEVLAADCGQKGIERAQDSQPDAILLDVQMPDLNGLEVCRRLKADAAMCQIPVLLVTGNDQAEEIAAGFAAGANDYLVKPILPPVLFARLAALIRTARDRNLAAAAIEQLRRTNESFQESQQCLARQNAVLRAINQVFEKTLACESDREVAEACLAVALELTASWGGFISEKNAAGRCDTLAVISPGWGVIDEATGEPIALQNRVVRALWGQVLAADATLLTNAPSQHPGSVGTPKGHPPIASFLGVPLKHAGKTFGMIALANKEAGYTVADQEAIETLSVSFVQALWQKRAERAERESREVLWATFESVADGILVVDEEHRVTRANARFVKMWCLPPDALETADPETSLDHSLRVAEQPEMFLPRERRERFSSETTFDTLEFQDGRVYDRYSSPLMHEGKVRGRVYNYRDVTHIKQSQQKLCESEIRYRTLFEATSAAVLLFDGDTFIECNPATLEMFGRTKAEFLTLHPRDISPDRQPDGRDSESAIQADTHTVMQEGKHQFEWVCRRRDGRDFPVELLLTAIDLDGRRVVQAIVTDMSHRKAAEEALRKKDEQCRQMQKLEAVGMLAGGIAHEFNNLLQAIMGYTTCAAEGLSPGDQRYADLQCVLDAAGRAATLTRQLLGFSRQRVFQFEAVDPNQLLGDLVKMVRPLIGEQIALRLELASSLGTVDADAGELEQALLNLCLNARDAMPGGGDLVLRTAEVLFTERCTEVPCCLEPGSYVEFTVADTGCGISAETRTRIFEPFFTTKEVGKGTGLGLAMVYGVVQRHQGAIRVSSVPGRGSTFKIYLPVGRTAALAHPAEPPPVGPHGTETILVAEDEPIVRSLAVRILTAAGYTVLEAANGEEALQVFAAQNQVISLVLLDAIMPKISGDEACRQIHTADPAAKVVFCSGYDPETAASSFVVQKHLRLIQKPFQPETLLRVVREVLDEEAACPVLA